ncbi:AcrR family transcriptional regulator [Paraburkholderia youngii]
MTTTTKRAAARRSPAKASASPAPVIEEKEPRGARRKRETRARLLDAALRLMAERGMEGVAINEITEAADVGFGSFYNHFESKEAIYATLVDNVFEEFANVLDRLAGGITDPAEVVAVSVRHTILRARHDPVWGRFLIREGFSAPALSRGLAQRLMRGHSKWHCGKAICRCRPVYRLPRSGRHRSFCHRGRTELCRAGRKCRRYAEGAGFQRRALSGAHGSHVAPDTRPEARRGGKDCRASTADRRGSRRGSLRSPVVRGTSLAIGPCPDWRRAANLSAGARSRRPVYLGLRTA